MSDQLFVQIWPERKSKCVWFDGQVTRRVGDVTGLDMDTAEDLQVVNYGIGGHYEPHFDYARV